MKINATSPVDKEANSTSSAMFLSSEDICAQLFDPVPLEQLLACSSPYTPTQAIFVGLLLGLLALGTAIGNLLIILAVLLVRRLRTPGNLLILNLALSDFLVSVLVLPFAIIYQLEGFWRLDQSVCTLYILADVLLCTSSILGLCAISIDRFMAINSPLDYPRRRTTCKMILMILLCWTVSALISVTPLFGWDRPDFGYQCAYNNEPTYQFYAIFSAFFLPLSVMLILYGRIFLVARRMAHKDAKQSSKWNSPTPVNFSVGMAGPFEESVWQIKNYEISKNINNLEEEEVLVQSIGHKNVDIWGFSNGSHANHLLPGKLFLLDSARFNRWLRRKTWCPVRIVQFKASPITQYESSSGMSPVMGSSSSTKSHNTLSNKEIRTNAARSKDGKVQQKNSLTMKDHSPDAVEMPTVLGLGRRHSKQTMLRLSKEEILFNGNQYNGEVSECEAESKSNPMTIRDMQTTPDEQGANSNWKPASEKSNVFRSSESDSHNKAVLTLGVIMGCFTICWLPFFTTQVALPFLSSYRNNFVISYLKNLMPYFNFCLNVIVQNID
ncbi:unnamed protein product [Protopolystoma xenopodis]|uniref:G-protein coupled receptors family 1 profile domain-containing protein n=1 Tax=Protopolystoma xenopodis TaxID=117903 RepID=A0A3S5AD34_9PLAT|nr:unnamed protein product [Protopolystoma xenopodis]